MLRKTLLLVEIELKRTSKKSYKNQKKEILHLYIFFNHITVTMRKNFV
jgi:hypothetical protein